MRIFYVGQLWEGGTCGERMRTLRSLGHETVPFDTTPWTSGGNRLLRSLAHRLNAGPNVWGMNRALLERARGIGPVDLIWIDKGRWVYPATLSRISEQTGGRLLHYTPDAQLVLNQSRHFERGIPQYDWLATTKPFELERYRALGARELLFVPQGYDPRFASYRPEAGDEARWGSDVCFIGHCEPHYVARVKAASEAGPGLRVWGQGWLGYAKANPWARPVVGGDGVWGLDYLRALSHAKIAIGLLSKWMPETTTTRSFEIPAIGTFLLAERTADHLALFEEGKEAEFFADDEELKSKLRFYLSHDEARRKIADAGRERSLRSGYSGTELLAGLLARLPGPIAKKQ